MEGTRTQREASSKARGRPGCVNEKATAFHLEPWRPRRPGPLSLLQPELGQHEADSCCPAPALSARLPRGGQVCHRPEAEQVLSQRAALRNGQRGAAEPGVTSSSPGPAPPLSHAWRSPDQRPAWISLGRSLSKATYRHTSLSEGKRGKALWLQARARKPPSQVPPGDPQPLMPGGPGWCSPCHAVLDGLCHRQNVVEAKAPRPSSGYGKDTGFPLGCDCSAGLGRRAPPPRREDSPTRCQRGSRPTPTVSGPPSVPMRPARPTPSR